MLSHRKFGFRILCLPELRPTSQQAEKMLVQLNKSIKIADSLIRSELDKRLRDAQITLVNAYVKLSNMYDFFRKKAKQAFRRKPPKGRVLKNKDGRAIGTALDPWKYQFEGFYYSISMMDAYFSRLEHLFIFVLPFIGFDAREEPLQVIIQSLRTIGPAISQDSQDTRFRICGRQWPRSGFGLAYKGASWRISANL